MRGITVEDRFLTWFNAHPRIARNLCAKYRIMELGISMFGDLHHHADGRVQTPEERLKELLEQVKLMDEAGPDFFGLGEHHRADFAVSAPEIVPAAVARLKLPDLFPHPAHVRSLFEYYRHARQIEIF